MTTINNILSTLKVQNTLNKPIHYEHNTIKDALSFLQAYKPSVENSTLAIFSKNAINASMIDTVHAIYKHASYDLPILENSIIDAKEYYQPGDYVESYSQWKHTASVLFSIHDAFYNYKTPNLEKLRKKFNFKFLFLLTNSYKFIMMKELLLKLHIFITDDDLIFKLCLLTCTSMGSEGIVTPNEFYSFQEELKAAPDWEFCKSLMYSYNLAFIVHNINNDKMTIYNKSAMTSQYYILFEFHHLKLLILRTVNKN